MIEKLINDWDYELNKDIDPHTLADHSNKKFYWKCPKGHPSYLMSINKRSIGQGCPVCSNHKIISGINDFATCHPKLMEEWSLEDNDRENIDPTVFSAGSGTIAWWKCKTCGNKWQASVVNRAKKHSGCPYCANLKVMKGFNDLLTLRPELAKEWDYEKNKDVTPDSIVAYYSKKVWWKCRKCNQSWQASPNARSKSGCPYCSNTRISKGHNDLESNYPDLIKEWDYERNTSISPSQVPAGSEKKAWWKCQKGHSWEATINSRARGNGCPYCSNKKVLPGYNDLFTTNPELKDEWDYAKNNSAKISPLTLSSGSNKKAYWICKKCGHSWKALVSTRSIGYGCPECGKQKNQLNRLKTMAANNPLFEKFPELQKEWDFEKNKGMDISTLPASSNKYAWWKCDKGHSYRCQINSRTNNKQGCPYCHGQRVLTGINDLQTLNPELAEEWDYEKNAPLKPSDVFSHSTKHVWWKCPICGESWKAQINNRANGRGCPNCNPTGTSFVEQALFYYTKQLFPDAENRYIYNGYELDIYIPSQKIAIEYDGAFFHSIKGSVERERKKDSFCMKSGINLIRLREKPLEATDNATNISCDTSSWDALSHTCRKLLEMLNPVNAISISLKDDFPSIIQSKRERMKDNSFAKLYPALLNEWDYEKNAPLLPDYFTRGSNMKAWWRCKNGHSWKASISNRCKGTGCPECFAQKRSKGLNKKRSK